MEETSNQAERINDLIKELLESNEVIRKRRDACHNWKINHSTLATLIWSGKVKNAELTKREAKCRVAVAEAVKTMESKEQQLKDLSFNRISRFSDRCDEIRTKGAKLAENFLRAQSEYSNENLSRNAADFLGQFEAISEELPEKFGKFAELQTLCRSEGSDEISKINVLLTNIMKTKSEKSEKINEAVETLQKLRGQINQKKVALKNFQSK